MLNSTKRVYISNVSQETCTDFEKDMSEELRQLQAEILDCLTSKWSSGFEAVQRGVAAASASCRCFLLLSLMLCIELCCVGVQRVRRKHKDPHGSTMSTQATKNGGTYVGAEST